MKQLVKNRQASRNLKINPPVVGIFGNINKPEVFQLLRGITDTLTENGFDYYIERILGEAAGIKKKSKIASPNKILSKAGVVFSLGGDGTFLNTAQIVGDRNIPILGVNMGRLGYYSEVSPEDIEKFIPNLRTGKYIVSDQVILKSDIRSGKSLFALNDIVIDKSSSIRMLEFETFFNQEKIVRFISDGIIISTPSGSTAYSLSCNGPIVNPHSKVFVITPISPHTLNVRPIIVPDTEVISVRILTHGKARITSDGQKAVIVNSPSEIKISKAPFTVKAIKKLNSSYFNTLKKKLHWGEDIRHAKSPDQ